MKYEELTEEMRTEIVNAIQSRLLKLGISADVVMYATTIYNGRELVHVETNRFQSTPVIYKAVHVDGDGFIKPVEGREDVFKLAISLGYRFEYFSGGSNGVDIGAIEFRLFKKSGRVACIGLLL